MILGRRLRRRLVAASAGRDQRGETLLELLLTMMIIGTVVLTGLTALTTMSVATRKHSQSVTAGNIGGTVAEHIEALLYSPCADAATFNTAAVTGSLPNGYTATVTGVRYLASADAAVKTATWVDRSTCLGAGDQGAQQITIQVVGSGSHRGDARVVTVKRDSPACPSGMPNPPPAGARC